MESKWGFRLTKKTEADLNDVVSYIMLELSNPKAATDFMDKLQGIIEETRSFPESGSAVINEFLPDMEIRKKLIGNYIMYYLPDVTEKTILILRIIYERRNMDEIFRRLDL